MGATYWLVPEESRTELHSPRLALLAARIVDRRRRHLRGRVPLRWTEGNKLLEQPLPIKLGIVVVMLMFLYNIGMTIWKAKKLTTTEGVLVAGLALTAILYLPALVTYNNYTVSIYYLLVDGASLGGGRLGDGARCLLAYLLIRLSGADRE